MSTRTSSNSRKRKADVDDSLSSGRKLKLTKPSPSSSSPAAHLPASCLAAILNFMEYAEVRRCLLAGKIMAVDAARHVEVLSIMNASELVPSAARRFANVTEINILSLIASTEADDEDQDGDILSADTATRSVPFLMTFPKLKLAFLGGLLWDGLGWSKKRYEEVICDEPKDHLAIFRGLVDHLCGAFRSRSLSLSLHIEGIVETHQLACHEDKRKDGHRCRRCWNVITSFPPDWVLNNIPDHYGYYSPARGGFCLSYSECIEALATRHDYSSLIQSRAAIECFLKMVEMLLGFDYVYPDVDAEKTHFIERVMSQGGRVGKTERQHQFFVRIHYISVKYMDYLKKFGAFIGPSVIGSIPKSELLSAVSPLGKVTKAGKKCILARVTFDGLVQLGFDLASKDHVLFDTLNEDALRDYHHRFGAKEEAS